MKFYELYNMLPSDSGIEIEIYLKTWESGSITIVKPSGIREGKYSAFIKVFSNFTVASIDVYSDTLQVVLI